MPSQAEILGTPPLRKKWKEAKQKAIDAAKQSKETAKLDELEKNKFKDSLGPDLEAWPKLYPNWNKLQAGKAKIDKTIDGYATALKASGLSDNVRKLMSTPLKQIRDEMEVRLVKAHELLSSDLELATKASKKAVPPIVLVQQDVARLVAQKAGATRLKPIKIELEIILSDDKVLKHVPADLDDALLAQKIRDRANFGSIIDELAALLKKVDNMEVSAAEAKYESEMGNIIHEALQRAAEPIMELVKVRSDYRMYKIKMGATLAVATAGVVASITSLAASPFTGGVSTVAGIIGTFKSVSEFGFTVRDLVMNTESSIAKATQYVGELHTQYKSVSSTVVGVGEIGKVTVNSLVGPWITTIKSAKEACEKATSKNNGLIVRSHDKAETLGEVLKEQKQLYTDLQKYEQANKDKFTPEEVAALLKVQHAIEQSGASVQKLIASIGALYKRTEENKTTLASVQEALAPLAAKEPTWSKVGQMFAQVAVTAGMMVAGGVNVPEPMECIKLTKDIVENVGRALESLNAIKELLEGFHALLKKHKK